MSAGEVAPVPVYVPEVGTDSLGGALAYAAIGWRVIPIPAGTKHPREQAWQNEGTTDVDRIRHWWTNAPDDGIGILTGPGSGVWVLDVDVSGEKVGDETLAELEEAYFPLPETYEVVTGSGGRHLYFAWPEGGNIRNSSSGLGPGLDVRGIGGQVLAPPTVHPNGNRYEHEASSPLVIAEAPGWLVALASPQERERPAHRLQPARTDRPGDQWAASVTWAQILEPDGWTHAGTGHEGEERWTRPGKSTREGISATTGYKGSDVLKVFTTSVAELTAEETYTKLGYLAATRHGGDHSAAARALRGLGFGEPPAGITLTDREPTPATKALEAAQPPPSEPWPDLKGFEAVDPRPAFPLHALPDWIRDQVDNVTRQLLCDPVLPATFALGALSVASLGHITIAVRAGQTERSTGIYIAVAGPPASGKSPALDMMMDPVRTHERNLITAAKSETAEAEQSRKIAAKIAEKAAEVAASTKDPNDLVAARNAAAEVEAVEMPPHGELMTTDITPERLASLMADNAERMAIVSDEAGVLDVDRYGDKGAAKKLDIYLQSFTGQPVAVHRVKAPTVRLERPLLAICAGVQPSALGRAMADTEWRTRGMGARFLTAATDQIAANTDIDRDVWDHAAGDTYTDTLGRLCRRWSAWISPAALTIAPEAREAFSAWAAGLRDRELGGDLVGESGWASKMRTSTIRLAALLHLAADPQGDLGVTGEITPEAMAAAIEIGEFFIASHLHEAADGTVDARRLLAALVRIADGGTNGETEGNRAESDDGAVVSRATNRFVARRDLARRGPRGLRTADETSPVLRVLVEAGLVRPVVDGGATNGQASDPVVSAKVFELHPEAHEWVERATARDTRDNTPGEGAEIARGADHVAHVARVAEEGVFDPSLSVVFADTPHPGPHPRATRATRATESESHAISVPESTPVPAELEGATPPHPGSIDPDPDLF